MKIDIIKIGNSQGIRIPLSILKQCNITNSVELSIDDNNLILSPYKTSRLDWEKKFESMSKNNDDQILDNQFEINSWDEEEWEW